MFLKVHRKLSLKAAAEGRVWETLVVGESSLVKYSLETFVGR